MLAPAKSNTVTVVVKKNVFAELLEELILFLSALFRRK